MQIGLRNIESQDFDFLWRLHNAALKKYITETWGWDEGFQRKHFEENFNTADGNIIVYQNRDIGLWWTIEKPDEFVLASIRILPEFQNLGIGTKLIGELISATEKLIRLQVLKVNPARRLYEKLGFILSGETDTHFLMKFSHEPPERNC